MIINACMLCFYAKVEIIIYNAAMKINLNFDIIVVFFFFKFLSLRNFWLFIIFNKCVSFSQTYFINVIQSFREG